MGPICMLAMVAASAVGAEEVPAELLQKLAAHEARMMAVYREYSVTMGSRVEELNGDGKVEHWQELVVRLQQKDGKPDGQILRAAKDGQDVTAGEQQEAEARKAKAEAEGASPGREAKVALTTPFGAEVQEKYRFQLLGPDPHVPSRVRVGFAPRGKKSKDLWIGEAVVDPEKGALHWMKQRPSEYPAFMDRMEMVLEFHASTPAGPAISEMRIEGKAGLPFFKKEFRAVTTFTGYAPPAAPPAPAP